MSASTGQKVLAVLAFVLIGAPAGLCTILFTPVLFSGGGDILFLWLMSAAITGVLGWLVVRVFRS